jgi:beta-fructofuranosidase
LSFSLPDHWVWDFWLANDGQRHHLFFLHAPKSLRDPDLRHRNARIGHASSEDLVTWTHHGLAFPAGDRGSFDDTATWTGSVVRGPDGLWRMYYTGSHFLSPGENANVETIGMATSSDLFTWTKVPGPVCRADERWYETLGSSSWPEEAWRDPWVYPSADGTRWHMLITARANRGDVMERGVIGHAESVDMEHWEVREPLSAIGAGFAHIEVPQVAAIGGRHYLFFSCDTARLSGRLAGQEGGVWYVIADNPEGPFDIAQSRLLAPQRLYAGRVAESRELGWVFLAFENVRTGDDFAGRICDPLPIEVDVMGALSIPGVTKQ